MSVVIVNSPKGEEYIRTIMPCMDSWKLTKELCIQPNMEKPSYIPDDRQKAWDCYLKSSFRTFLMKYGRYDFAHKIEAAYQLLSDCQRYHDSTNPKIYVRHLDVRPNAIIIRVAWSVACWDTHSFCIARLMAEVFNEHLEADKNKELPADLKVKDIGYDNYLL